MLSGGLATQRGQEGFCRPFNIAHAARRATPTVPFTTCLQAIRLTIRQRPAYAQPDPFHG